MVVGFKKFWKLPIAYFLTNSVDADTQAGFIREALIRTYDCGIIVRNVTMDGPPTNMTTYEKLGAHVIVDDINLMVIEFAHPHPEADSLVLAYPDPVHNFKNTRNLFGDYKVLHWEGEGEVNFDYVVQLHNIQEDFNFRLGNKLTGKHVYYQNKMLTPLMDLRRSC